MDNESEITPTHKLHAIIKADQEAANAKVSNVPAPAADNIEKKEGDVPPVTDVPPVIPTGSLPADQSPSAQLGITGVVRDGNIETDL